MAMDFLGLSVGMGYTDETVIGAGALKGEKGDDGKSAYQYAQDGGYIGTETEFTTNIARSGVISKELEVERARIDNLTTLQDGSTTGDGELTDIRIGYDGTEYANAGVSVRTQISNIHDNLDNGNKYDEDFYMFLSPFYLQTHLLEYAKKIGLTNGKYVTATSGKLADNVDYCVTPYLPIRTDTTFLTETYGGVGYCAFYNENKEYISGNALSTTYLLTVPDNAKYLRYSCPISAYDTNVFTQWKYPNATTFNVGENVRVPYSQIIDKPEIIEVNVSDYTNLRECLESITPSEKRHYVVKLPNGTYDVKSMYTDTERNESGFIGLFVPNYTKILGTGNKEDTIIRYDNSSNEAISEAISTLHFRDWVEMENVTVIGSRIRYAVHDDYPTNGFNVNHRLIKNCDFKVYESYYNSCYGSGQTGGTDWTFENCNFEILSVNTDFNTPDFLRAFLNHSSTNVIKSSKFLFDNCNFKTVNESIASVRFTSMTNGSTAFNYVTFKGCRINGEIALREENPNYGAGNLFKINGYANNFSNDDVTLLFTDGVDYSSWIDLH